MAGSIAPALCPRPARRGICRNFCPAHRIVRPQGSSSMPRSQGDLNGNVPDKAPVALLLIDVINDLEFPEGDQLLRFAEPMAQQIALLKQRARQAKIPVIYVNDNFGRWRSNFQA